MRIFVCTVIFLYCDFSDSRITLNHSPDICAENRKAAASPTLTHPPASPKLTLAKFILSFLGELAILTLPLNQQAGSIRHMVEPNFRGGDVALFIDWENFKISLAAGNRSPNLSALKEEVSNQGRMVVAKAYADWVTRAPELRGASQFIIDPPSLYAAGIEPVFVPTRIPSTQASSANGMRTYRVKNSVDVKMTADCIECAHSYPNIGTFVLVSGDSDFLHVVNALRTMGKRVVIIGVSWSTSRRLADQVDSLLLYDKDVDPLAPQPAVLPQHAVAQREAPADAPELAEVIKSIEDIIRDERAAGGNPLLTSIKQRLMRRYPSFDEKKLGFSGFKKLMARAAEDGNIKLIHAGLVDWAIMADEETPEGTTEEQPSGVAARPSRRRGGRRRHGGQRDDDSDTTDGAEETSGDEEALGDEEADIGPALADAAADLAYTNALEETAATDFDLPVIADLAMPEDLTALEPEAMPDFSEVLDASEAAEPEDGEDSPVDEAVVASEEPAAEPESEDVFGNDEELAAAVRESLAAASLPAEPDDGQASERVSDLIVMADTLEHRQGVSHVAFNFLVTEVCGALEQGLAAGNEQIAGRWSDTGTRDYVGKMLRGLSEGGFFRRGTHTWRDETSGRRRQRSTFNLDRGNELVGRMLTARLGPAANTTPPVEPAGDLAPPPSEAADTTQAATVPQSPVEQQPDAGQLALVDSADGAEATPPPEEPAPEEPAAEQPSLPVEEDEVYDEPQPRNVRRRPFTSRLLRS